MPRQPDAHEEILRFFGALGWRAGDDAEDLARMRVAAQSSALTADEVLAKVAAAQPPSTDDDESACIIPFENPLADGLARAARNGGDISSATEARMCADRAAAKRAKRPRTP